MKRFGFALGAFVLAALPGVVSAQPAYRAAFMRLYDVKPDSKIAKAGCQVCHGSGNDLKNLNGYGLELRKELGKPKASEDEAAAALKKIEEREVKVRIIDLLKADAPPVQSKPAS